MKWIIFYSYCWMSRDDFLLLLCCCCFAVVFRQKQKQLKKKMLNCFQELIFIMLQRRHSAGDGERNYLSECIERWTIHRMMTTMAMTMIMMTMTERKMNCEYSTRPDQTSSWPDQTKPVCHNTTFNPFVYWFVCLL